MSNNIVVFDIGGTLIKYALMNSEAEILEKGEVPTPKEDQPTLMNALSDVYAKYMDQADGVAISIPGNVDSDTGYVYTPGALLYNQNTPFASILEETIEKRTGKKVFVTLENDGKSAALAELWKGHLQGCTSGVVMILGTGIGGGIIIDGKIVKGKDFFAGELSFLLTDFNDPKSKTLLATTAATSYLVNESAKAIGANPAEFNGYKVFEEIEAGNEKVIAVFDKVCSFLACQVYNLVCTLNPDKILIGGGVSKQPKLLENIKKHYEMLKTGLGRLGANVPEVVLDTTRFYNDSNLIGALYNYYLLHPVK